MTIGVRGLSVEFGFGFATRARFGTASSYCDFESEFDDFDEAGSELVGCFWNRPRGFACTRTGFGLVVISGLSFELRRGSELGSDSTSGSESSSVLG
jgi:hypothetical protein